MRSNPAIVFAEALRGSRLCFQCFRLAVPRRRVSDQRFEQMMRDMGNVIDRAIESGLVRLRRLGESGQLPNKLERRRTDLVIRRRWTKIMQGLNSSAHTESFTERPAPASAALDQQAQRFRRTVRAMFLTSGS